MNRGHKVISSILVASMALPIGQPSWAVQHASRLNYTVSVEASRGESTGPRLLTCSVSFHGRLPAPNAVDKILRIELEKAVRSHPKNDILAAAFRNNDTLEDGKDYTGMLVYTAASRAIKTMDDYRGVKKSSAFEQRYAVETEEDHTDVKPLRSFLEITLVYPSRPSRHDAYGDLLREIAKAANRHEDIDAYVSIGNKKVPTSWRQMRDLDGAYVFANYDASSGRVSRRGAQLPRP